LAIDLYLREWPLPSSVPLGCRRQLFGGWCLKRDVPCECDDAARSAPWLCGELVKVEGVLLQSEEREADLAVPAGILAVPAEDSVDVDGTAVCFVRVDSQNVTSETRRWDCPRLPASLRLRSLLNA
jgi:hypothetical protein